MNSKIFKTVELEIGGEVRKMKFTIGSIEELEALLPEANVFELIKKELWSVSEIITAVYCGLKTFDRKLTRETVKKWVDEYAKQKEAGIQDLRIRAFAAIGLSGLLGGEAETFINVLNLADGKEYETEKQEDNNAGE